MDRDSLLIQCTLRDLQSSLRTETIRADRQADLVAHLTDQVARLAEKVACLAEQVNLLEEPEQPPEQPPSALPFAASPPPELPPAQDAPRPSKRRKAVPANTKFGGRKVSAVEVPTPIPPVEVHLNLSETTESEEPSPYKPSPTPADLIDSPIDYSPAPSPQAPDNKYKNPHRHAIGEYCVITSKKSAHTRGHLVWISRLAGQYCFVITSTGEKIKKHSNCLGSIPPPPFLTEHFQYKDLQAHLSIYKEQLAGVARLDKEHERARREPSPTRSPPPPGSQVDEPTPATGESDHEIEKGS